MIIASIAMEELALSHIINAEGEKLQYILGTLPGMKPCAEPQDILAVNKSVACLLDVVAQNQMLLKSKLEKVLEACPPPARPCPPPYPGPYPPVCPPCPPAWGPEPCQCGSYPPPQACGPECSSPCCGTETRSKSALHLLEQRAGLLWDPGCRLPWRQETRKGDCICWNKHNPTQIQLDPRRAYAVRYTLEVCAMPPAQGEGIIRFRQTPCGTFSQVPPLSFSLERCAGRIQTLQYAAVLHPCTGGMSGAELSLVLDTRNALCVERAAMDVVEL